jgi:hypothetical protein
MEPILGPVWERVIPAVYIKGLEFWRKSEVLEKFRKNWRFGWKLDCIIGESWSLLEFISACLDTLEELNRTTNA